MGCCESEGMDQPTPAFTLSAVATTAACALLAVMVLALTPLPAAAAHTAQTGSAVPANPPANVVASPNYDGCTASGVCGEVQPCYTANFAPAFTSAACEREELEAIDHARAKEGVGPMYLPSDFNSLSGDEQLLVVIDLERVDRGLAPLAGIVASLDGVAQQGTQVQGQPAGTFEDPRLRGRLQRRPGHGDRLPLPGKRVGQLFLQRLRQPRRVGRCRRTDQRARCRLRLDVRRRLRRIQPGLRNAGRAGLLEPSREHPGRLPHEHPVRLLTRGAPRLRSSHAVQRFR